MKERPIIFSGVMVRAILDGNKTQTRRIASQKVAEAIEFMGGGGEGEPATSESIMLHWGKQLSETAGPIGREQWLLNSAEYPEEGCIAIGAPYGHPGDALWVRETFCRPDNARVIFRADGSQAEFEESRAMRRRYPELARAYPNGAWKPAIHMPRSIARILLRVTEVRLERVQDITEEDAIAEGVRFTDFGEYTPNGTASLDGGKTFHRLKPRRHPGFHVSDVCGPDECHYSARSAFEALWESINGRRAPWASNPWVWAITFEGVQ